MNEATIKRLNQINREFYRVTAAEFDETRGQPWPGWERLRPHLAAPLRVLDLGCGNGRFGVFVAQQIGPAGLHYTGLDSSAALLERARLALAGIDARLDERDLVEGPLPAGEYDLVAALGIVHHVPGRAQRLAWLGQAAGCVAPGGLLVFATWRFYEYERFRARVAPWPEDLPREPGDYLLDWRRGVPALRYCHYVDDAEHAELAAATGLAAVDNYRADGATGDMNAYTLLKRVTS